SAGCPRCRDWPGEMDWSARGARARWLTLHSTDTQSADLACCVAGGPGPCGDTNAVADPELGLNVGDVRLDRSRRNEQLIGDFGVGVPGRHRTGDFAFAGGQ